jgi:glycerophosphoryl diester phosphodiesterase
MKRVSAGIAGLLAALVVAAPASAVPTIHAHRGGPVLSGVPTFPENTMPAFQHAANERFVVELDAKLTQDNVPVVIHDATLDRTTNCTGQVRSFTSAALAGCKADVLGVPGSTLPTRQVAPTTSIPTLQEVLGFATGAGATLNLEIKNVPTDPDFDSTPAFANRVMDTVVASGFPRARLIVQSFWPPNLDVAKARLPGVETSLLTLNQANEGAPEYASANGHAWISPQWPVSKALVDRAHSLGRRVVPFTLDTENDIRTATATGVDALITNDPFMAQRALGISRAGAAPDRRRPVVRLDAPNYASDRSRTRRIPIRWRGVDQGSGVARYRLEVRRRTNAATPWRVLVDGTTRTRASFRGLPGASYAFRLRARDRSGNLSRYAYDKSLVPLDDRSRRIRYSPGWRRVRSRRAYGRSVRRGRRGASATLVFRGSAVALIATRRRGSARVFATVDGRPRIARLRGRRGHRRVVLRFGRLRPGRHRLHIRAFGGRAADLDAIAVDSGPASPGR